MDARTTYAKLNGHREEVRAGGLRNSVTTSDTREVDEAGLDNALLALGCLDHLLSEATSS